MSVFVFSTLTGSHKYPIYRKPRGGADSIPQMESYVLIHGGANLATKHLITPKGVVTKLTNEEYTRLKESPAFQRHFDRGYLKVEFEDYDADEVADDMTSKDGSAPMTPDDFGDKAPTTSGESSAPNAQTEIRPGQKTKAEKTSQSAPAEPPADSNSDASASGQDDAAGTSGAAPAPDEKPKRRRRSRPKKDK